MGRNGHAGRPNPRLEVVTKSGFSSVVSRRALVTRILPAAGAAAALAFEARASGSFETWREAFRRRAAARGISDATYRRVMDVIEPDTSVYAEIRSQPEFNEALWQYINRRASDWRIITGKARAQEY
ncbi:MAG: lytic murein transglycosylase, partial [Bradyrhizobiaceae bacterium]|nr:lytic murein transglycosylase [Bradyrhizobiaceae bacterium]